ncbi:MAG TPA: hypothetical protein VK524_03210 [Polyangiaceae bacterium]|nr:hypothetical protein [Polyangiaceae bacterium]
MSAILQDIEIEQGATFLWEFTEETEVKIADGAMTTLLGVLTATLAFTVADIGRSIVVAGADRDGNDLRTTVLAYVSATQVTLSKPAVLSVAGAKVTITRPVDLSGATGRMQIRGDYADTTVLLSLATGSGMTLGGTSGTVAITATPIQTSAMPHRPANYDVELVLASGAVRRARWGRAHVRPEVTRT